VGFWIYFGGAPCIAGFQQQGRDLLGIVANAIPVMQGFFVRFLAEISRGRQAFQPVATAAKQATNRR